MPGGAVTESEIVAWGGRSFGVSNEISVSTPSSTNGGAIVTCAAAAAGITSAARWPRAVASRQADLSRSDERSSSTRGDRTQWDPPTPRRLDWRDARDDRPEGHVGALERAPRDRLRLGQRAGAAAVLHGRSSASATRSRRVLMLAVLVSSSLMQPLFGLWSDRRGALWLLPAGLALAGAGIGLAAVAPSYGLSPRPRLPLGDRHRGVPSRRARSSPSS